MRSNHDRDTLRALLQPELRAWAPARPAVSLLNVQALDDMVSRSVAGPRFSATLISAFAGMALLLTAIGVFGLVAYVMSQRVREFGIRAALGARPRDR